MYSKLYVFNDKKYTFKLTRFAQQEIERLQKEQISKYFSDEELIKLTSKINAYQEDLEKINKIEDETKKQKEFEKLTEKNAHVLANMNKLETISEDPIGLYELGYILLTSYPKNPPISKEEYKMLCCEMEDELGYQETVEFFMEMKEKVFQEMELINKAMNKEQMSIPQ